MIIFALNKFQRYLLGRHFVTFTDHCSLLKIFREHEETSSTTFSCLQRWTLFLDSFDYKRAFKESAIHANAVGLLRHPVGSAVRIDTEIALIQQDLL